MLEHYRQHFASIGMPHGEEMIVEDTHYTSFKHADGSPGGAGLILRPTANGQTSISLAYEFNWTEPDK